MTWFIIALLSAFLSAFAAITQKKILFNLGALEFSFLLSLVNLVFSIPFFFFIDYGTINSFPLLALTPGFIAVFAFIFLGEALKTAEVLGLIILMLGTYILESGNSTKIIFPFSILLKSKYHRFVILALLLFTASSILDKLLLIKLNLSPISLTAFQHIYFAIMSSVIFFVFKKKTEPLPNIINKNNLGWIALISVLTIGYRYTQVVAIGLASVALVLAVKRTSVFWATIIGGRIFSDKDLLKRSIAAVLILVGAILILRE